MEDVGHLPVSSRQTSIKRTLIAVAVIVALGASIVLFKDLSGHDYRKVQDDIFTPTATPNM
jgi:hypothetical protein